MRKIAQNMSNESAVLKGGTGLLLCYNLDRFSEDMDFDGYGKFNFERIQKNIAKSFNELNIGVSQVIVKKDTPTTKRLMYHYDVVGSPDFAYPLKIEFSFRQAEETKSEDFSIINGIKVYNIDKLAKKKFNAFLERRTSRDVYDVGFFLKNHPKTFTPEMCNKILQIGADDIYNSFEQSKQDDLILRDVDSDALAVGIIENANLIVSSKDNIKKHEILEVEPLRIFDETETTYKVKIFNKETNVSTPIYLPKNEVKIMSESMDNQFVVGVPRYLAELHKLPIPTAQAIMQNQK